MNFEERKRQARSKYKVGDRVRIKDDYIGAVEINGLIGWIKVVQPESENLQFYRVAFASGLNVVTSEENLEADKPDVSPDDSTETIGAEPIAAPDYINKPPHYNHFSFQPIDIITETANAYEGSTAFHIGTVLKYLCRAPFKGNLLEDLKKANYYLQRAIDEMEEAE